MMEQGRGSSFSGVLGPIWPREEREGNEERERELGGIKRSRDTHMEAILFSINFPFF